MPWFQVTMTDEEVASGKHIQLQNQFSKVWMAIGAPPEAAMYGSMEVGKLHYYFTPHAAQIADPLLKMYSAVECEEPDLEKLAVLVKNEGTPGRGL